MMPPPETREERIAHGVRVRAMLAGSRSTLTEEQHRETVTLAIDRAYHPAGVGRQFLAILAAGSRVEALGRLQIPVLVIHGEEDPLLPVGNGIRTADSVPGSHLVLLPGLGHELPEAAPELVIEKLVAHFGKARKPVLAE
jgi:pimeloyl-ACP methyl ester carboxylesterase